MKTTINLPDELITESMLAMGSKSKIEAIKKALHEVILREKRLKLLNFKDKINLDSLRDRTSDV